MSLNLFNNLTFEKFRELAKNESLSTNEKIGFPDSYRKGKEGIIFKDILNKIPSLKKKNKTVMDIGCGCTKLPVLIAEYCFVHEHNLILIDSSEMLNQLPNFKNTIKIEGFYPNIPLLFEKYKNSVDVIIVYSVFQYIFVEGNIWEFLDKTLELLSDGGVLLIADLPNISMRKRYFLSNEGISNHKKFTQSESLPTVEFNKIEHNFIDDSIIISILLRVRFAGFHAWVIPQNMNLPMGNRREDILIKKP